MNDVITFFSRAPPPIFHVHRVINQVKKCQKDCPDCGLSRAYKIQDTKKQTGVVRFTPILCHIYLSITMTVLFYSDYLETKKKQAVPIVQIEICIIPISIKKVRPF